MSVKEITLFWSKKVCSVTIPSITLYLQSIRCIDLNLLAYSFSKTFTSVLHWLIKFLQKGCFQVDPAEDERSRYVQKIDSKSVSLLDYPNRCLTFTFHIHRPPKWVPNVLLFWFLNISWFYRVPKLTTMNEKYFCPRNPFEATGIVKRPWDQQVS